MATRICVIHICVGRERSIVDTLKKCIGKQVRVAAGLGNPPNKWSNQRVEAINSVIKEELGKQTDQVMLHKMIYPRVVKQQESEIIKAIYQMGEYCLSKEFKRLEGDMFLWFHKTPTQKGAHISKVFSSSPTSKTWPSSSRKLSTVVSQNTKM